jgi:hypothetical protein
LNQRIVKAGDSSALPLLKKYPQLFVNGHAQSLILPRRDREQPYPLQISAKFVIIIHPKVEDCRAHTRAPVVDEMIAEGSHQVLLRMELAPALSAVRM